MESEAPAAGEAAPEKRRSAQEAPRQQRAPQPERPPAALPAAAPGGKEEDAEEGDICRYCFEGAGGEHGELISPCNCSGGQKWVHLSCLRRWQRGVLVSQPTHPEFYDDDLRHKVCNVCKAPYTCRPPTRLELMQSFTGEELAALVEERSLIASHPDFSAELRRELGGLPEDLREQVVSRHWIDGAFLIVRVDEDGCTTTKLTLEDPDELEIFATTISSDWCWNGRGRRYRLILDGPLAAFSPSDEQGVRQAIRSMQYPAVFRSMPADEVDCGEDSILAVNLTRPADLSASQHAVKRLRFQALLRQALPGGEALLPRVDHFIGGPCRITKAMCALVVSGEGDYRIFRRPLKALKEAQELCRAAAASQPAAAPAAAGAAAGAGADGGAAAAGEHRRPKRRRLEKGPDDEAAAPAAAASTPASASTAAAAAEERTGGAAAAAEGRSRGPARVMLFWGTAGWTRCQLMGEIASGSWGLCKSTDAEVTQTAPGRVYEAVRPRLVYAPRSEMSERYREDEPNEQGHRALLLRLHRRLRRRQQQQEQLARLAVAAAELNDRARRLLRERRPEAARAEASSSDSEEHRRPPPPPGARRGVPAERPAPAGRAAPGAHSSSSSSSEDDDEDEDEEDIDDCDEEDSEDEDDDGEEEEEEVDDEEMEEEPAAAARRDEQ